MYVVILTILDHPCPEGKHSLWIEFLLQIAGTEGTGLAQVGRMKSKNKVADRVVDKRAEVM